VALSHIINLLQTTPLSILKGGKGGGGGGKFWGGKELGSNNLESPFGLK